MIADPQTQTGHPELRNVLEKAGFPARGGEIKNPLGAGTQLEQTIDAGRDYLQQMHKHGLSVPHWPAEFGGRDLTPAEITGFSSELAKFELPDLYPFLIGLNMVGPALCKFGETWHLEHLVPRIADGTHVWCQMFSERNAGSDLNSIATSAVQSGDHWIVNGEKMWCGRAGVSDYGILLANAYQQGSDKPRKTLFCLPMQTDGVQCHKIKQMNGDSNFYRVTMDDVKVPDRNRLGRVGGGWKIAVTMLKMERALSIDATGLGLDAENFTAIVGYLVGQDPVARDLAAKTYTTLWILTTGQKFRPLPNLRSLGFTFFQQISALLEKIEGPEAMLDGSTSTLITTTPSLGIRAGTVEIQKNTLAEKALRLPKF